MERASPISISGPMIYIGTSGFSYNEWKGGFYPDDLPAAKFLSYYSGQFNSTEINNTFYRIPSAKTTANWAQQVGPSFRFSLKLSQRITHKKRLRDCSEEMEWFRNGAEPLQGQLGCILVQLPPWFRQNLEVLDAFLEAHASNWRLALEFRHASWMQPETYQLLESRGASLGVVETDEDQAVREVTAPFVYVRLRKDDYSSEELDGWANWLNSLDRDVYVYLKHAAQAPAWAQRLSKAIGK